MVERVSLAGMIAGLGAFAALASPQVAGAACSFSRVAELPVTMNGLRPIVHAKINGQEVRLLLDTGAFYTMITPAAAQRVKMSTEMAENMPDVQGVGGDTRVRLGKAREVTFAGQAVKGLDFIVGAPEIGSDLDGIIGENFLKNADVEYDLAKGVVRLFVARGCDGVGLAYWKGVDANVMPIRKSDMYDPHIKGSAAVNGKVIDVLFDTGASTSILTTDAARKIGIPLQGEGVEAGGLSSGLGRGLIEDSIVPIQSFEVGGEAIQRTKLRVGRIRMEDTDMLLGADFFLSHHVMVANSQHRLYFTYNGGPVFRLDKAADTPATEAQAAGAAPTSNNEDAKLSADDLRRRAAASNARRDYRGAAAYLERATALEPQDAGLAAELAVARIRSGDSKTARSDLERALKLKPDDVTALTTRGELKLQDKDLEGAKADFAAAEKAAPDNDDLPAAFAEAYEANGHRELAIAEWDRWIVAHPKDPSLWQAFNARCRQRAMTGKDLDKALEDCETAVRQGRRNSEVLDSRAMVYLRLGKYDLAVADYDASIKAQPRRAWSHLGRGLAREKLGDASGAESDIKQALAIDPDVADAARKAGLDSPLLGKAKEAKAG